MKGRIKAYSTDVNAGVITCEDGHSYRFEKIDWMGTNIPLAENHVLFTGERGRASVVTEDKKTLANA